MIILSNGSLTKTGRFAPETMALNLSERGSTATITFGIGAASLSIGDWLQDDTKPGDGIVWRVKMIDTQYNTKTVTVQLEDMVNSLNDKLLNGEIKPSDIAGEGATTCTARQAVTYILNKQSIWTLGSFDYDSVNNPYNFNGDSLKAALETVSSSLSDPVWSYDFTTFPFRISITQLSNDIDSEMRMSRNINTLKVSIDRTRMYTRFYPIGKNNLRLDSPGYAEKNVSTYGLIEKTDTDETKDTTEKLASWAQEMLDKHAEPLVTATVVGLDLSADTGVSLDSFTIGKKCRMPLPEFGTTITEKVTKLSWKNKLAEPKNVTVTLANLKEDIASIVNRITSSVGRSGRAKAKNDEEDHAWIVDTNDHVSLVAEAVAGKDGDGNPNWSRVSELTVDGHGIDARVTQAEGDIITNAAEILMTQSMIHSAVWTANSELVSYIDQTATYISSHVEDINNDLHTEILQTQSMIHSAVWTANSELVSYIDQTATYILDHVEDVQNDLGSEILQTASQIRSEVHAADSALYSYVDETATYILSVVADTANDLGTAILQTASEIRSEAHASESELYSYVDQTATYIESVVADTANDLGSAILQTASEIRAEVHASNSELYSYVDQTATYIESVVADTANDLGSAILQTASEIRAEVHASNSELYSYVDQTATSITQAVEDVENEMGTTIRQTASQIYSAVYGAESEIYSYIDQTASSITISADRVYLDGNTTVSGMLGIENGGLKVKGNAVIDGDLTMTSGKEIFAGDIRVTDLRFPGSNPGEDVTIQRADVADMLVKAEVDTTTNTLKIWKRGDTASSPSITFSKAASGKVSGSWSGKTLTVVPSQTGSDSYVSVINTGLVEDTNTTPHTFHITAYHTDNGAQSQTEIQSARTQYTLGTLAATPKIVRILNASGSTYINGTATYTIPLQPKTISSNGSDITPDDGYVGFSSVTVAVNPVVGSTFVKDGSTYYVSATKDGTEVSTARKQIALAVSGSNVVVQDGRGTTRSNTPSLALSLDTGTLSSGSRTVTVKADGSATSVTATITDYTSGQTAAGISASWGTGSGANVLTVERALSSSTKSATYTVTAGNPTYEYNSSTHKYSLTGTALVNNTQKASGVSSTGTEAYDAGVTAGKTAAGISASWGTGSGANVLTVERALSSSTKSGTYTVTAGSPTYEYNSSTHKYSLTGTALVNNTQKASGVSSTGTEAYDAGKLSVTVTGPTWSSTGSSVGQSNSVSVSKDGTVQNTQYTYMYVDTSASKAYIRYASSASAAQTGGTIIGSVSIPSVNVNAGSWTTKGKTEDGRASRTYSPSIGSGSSYTDYIGMDIQNWNDSTGYVEMYAYSATAASGGTKTAIRVVPLQLSIGTWDGNSNTVTLKSDRLGPLLYWPISATDAYTNGYNSARIKDSWGTNSYTVEKTSSSSYGNSITYSINTDIYLSQGDYYVSTMRKASGASSWTSVAGTTKKLTIANVDNNTVKLQAAGSDTGLTFAHGKYSAGWQAAVNATGGMFFYHNDSDSSFKVVYPMSGGITGTDYFDLTASNGVAKVMVRGTSTECCTTTYSTSSYPQTKTMKCVGKTYTSSQWKYTFEYYNSSEIFNTNTNYKFHNNSSYT